MKNILLTTTALVAFAGAAAAGGHTSVSFGGEAAAEYNDITGFATSAEMTASMSAELDNGLTAAASITFESTAAADVVTASNGSVSLSSDTASLTFGTGLVGAIYSITADDYLVGTGALADGEFDGIVGTVTLGAANLIVSMPIGEGDVNAGDVEFGVTTTAGDWALGLGMNADGDYAGNAAGTVGGASLNFGFASNDEWDAGVSLPMGAVTLSASTDEAEAWTVGAAYDGGDYNAGIEYNADESWEITAGYAAGAVAVDAAVTDLEVLTLGGTYDMGNGLMVGAGLEGDDTYAFVNYDLGGGASAYVDYTDAAAELEEVGPSERDVAAGTTVGVSFTF